MSKYKIGDRVRIITDAFISIPLNSIAIIENINNDDIYSFDVKYNDICIPLAQNEIEPVYHTNLKNDIESLINGE